MVLKQKLLKVVIFKKLNAMNKEVLTLKISK